jgi:hypothetical protein
VTGAGIGLGMTHCKILKFPYAGRAWIFKFFSRKFRIRFSGLGTAAPEGRESVPAALARPNLIFGDSSLTRTGPGH